MFTGIIEGSGKVLNVEKHGANTTFWLDSPFTGELKVDQSLAHNGVCLTVTDIRGNAYAVTAVEETLLRTNLNTLQVGSEVNLERCLQYNGRLDGHIVQGHVDCTAVVVSITDADGSWEMMFSYEPGPGKITVEKGSITVNGVSLTVVKSGPSSFSVAVIPYTWNHTTFQHLKVNDLVNIEFDIIGKYVAKMYAEGYSSLVSEVAPPSIH